uniref:Junctional adhesion molecule 2a n=1 Tax=Amphilophus citrinellus TaxID=61819 RepID=A0A3Q0SMG5_AMPCI
LTSLFYLPLSLPSSPPSPPPPPGSPCVPVRVMTNRHNVEVEELKDAVLSCIFFTEVDQKPRIEWKKKGKDVSFVFYNGKFKGPFEGRATIDGATVTLKRVTQEDAGEYRCEISAPQDTVSLGETNVTLKVLVPPQIPLCEIPSSAVTGSVVQLRCRDQQGIPPATYSWYKDNKLIRAPHHANATYLVNSRTGVLEFKAVTKEDTGQYRCLASNGVGQSKTCEGKHMTIGVDLNERNHMWKLTDLGYKCSSLPKQHLRCTSFTNDFILMLTPQSMA